MSESCLNAIGGKTRHYSTPLLNSQNPDISVVSWLGIYILCEYRPVRIYCINERSGDKHIDAEQVEATDILEQCWREYFMLDSGIYFPENEQ